MYDINADAVQTLAKEGAVGATSIEDFTQNLKEPRVIWMMVPAAVVDSTLKSLIPYLKADDVVIDGGHSFYQDDMSRALNSSRSESITLMSVPAVRCGDRNGVIA